MDQISLERIKTLHPKIRQEVLQLYKKANNLELGKGVRLRFAYTSRTPEEQDKLYAQGRTKPGKKVTNAKAGQSVHNYGFAVDICLIIDGKVASWDTAKDWDNDKIADWYEVVKIFAKYGWEWGGNWKNFKDMPHFEKKGFNDWRKLQTYKRDSLGYVII